MTSVSTPVTGIMFSNRQCAINNLSPKFDSVYVVPVRERATNRYTIKVITSGGKYLGRISCVLTVRLLKFYSDNNMDLDTQQIKCDAWRTYDRGGIKGLSILFGIPSHLQWASKDA